MTTKKDLENEEDLSWKELVAWAKINGLKTGEFNKGLLILKDYETGHTWNFYNDGFVTLIRKAHCIDLAVEVTNLRTNRQLQYFIKGLLR